MICPKHLQDVVACGCDYPETKTDAAPTHGSGETLASARGYLPASRVETLAQGWNERSRAALSTAAEARTRCDFVAQAANKAASDIYDSCAYDLRAEMARANVRQPEDNAKLSRP